MANGISPLNPDYSAALVTDRPGSSISQKDMQDFNKTSNKQPSPGLINMDFNNGTDNPSITATVLMMTLSSVAPNLQCVWKVCVQSRGCTPVTKNPATK
jgi:hypothetical protein